MWGPVMEPMNISIFQKRHIILCFYCGFPKTSHPIQCIVVYIQITPCSACLLHVIIIIIIIYDTAEDVRDAVSSLQIRDSCHVRSIIIRYKMN